jgi:hypothetical protein
MILWGNIGGNMNAETYDRVMNLCVACGVLSALLFDQAGSFKSAVGGLGILSGSVAVTFYFHNRWTSAGSRKTRDERITSHQTTVALSKAVITEPRLEDDSSICQTYVLNGPSLDNCKINGSIIIGYPNQFSPEVSEYWQTTSYRPIIVAQPCDPVEHVVGIVKRLSEQEGPPFEFVLARDGSLTIRRVSEYKGSSTAKGLIANFGKVLDWPKLSTGKTN